MSLRDKATFASIQQSQSTIAEIDKARRTERIKSSKTFKQILYKAIDELIDDWANFEAEIGVALDGVDLGDSVLLAAAISLLRKEAKQGEIDESYFNEVRDKISLIFDIEFAKSTKRIAEQGLLERNVNTRYVGKALHILEEEKKFQNFSEDSDDE